MTTIQSPYLKWLRDQSQYPTDFDLTSIRLNWTETLVWNGPLSAEDQLPSRIIVWRYFGKIYWVETTKLLLLAWHLLHWQISFKCMKIWNHSPQYLPILNASLLPSRFSSWGTEVEKGLWENPTTSLILLFPWFDSGNRANISFLSVLSLQQHLLRDGTGYKSVYKETQNMNSARNVREMYKKFWNVIYLKSPLHTKQFMMYEYELLKCFDLKVVIMPLAEPGKYFIIWCC